MFKPTRCACTDKVEIKKILSVIERRKALLARELGCFNVR